MQSRNQLILVGVTGCLVGVLLPRGDFELAYELGSELSDSQRTWYKRDITAEWVNTSQSAFIMA